MSVQEIQAAEVTVNAAAPSLWSSIGEAMRGSHQDFTKGSLNRAILLLAIPMVLEMVLESLFAVVDVLWVSRLGADAVATVGLTESLLTLVGAVGLGLSLSPPKGRTLLGTQIKSPPRFPRAGCIPCFFFALRPSRR